MASRNKVSLAGNLTRDPELRYTTKGVAVVKFSIAVNRRYKTESGEQRDEVTYVECEAWAKLAELIGEHFRQGSPILIDGRLKLDQWDDKTSGEKRSKLKVIAEEFTFIGSKREDGDAARPAPPAGKTSRPAATKQEGKPTEGGVPPEDDDVPF